MPVAKSSHGNEPQTEAPMSEKIPNKYSINDYNDDAALVIMHLNSSYKCSYNNTITDGGVAPQCSFA